MDSLVPKEAKTLYKLIEKCVGERIKVEEEFQKQGGNDKTARKDMFHYLFQVKDSETGLPAYPSNSLFQEAWSLIVAGSDTTTTTVSATVFYLARNLRAYNRLAQEIRTTFQTVDEICGGPKLWSCRYLRACIDEAMRMSPPVPAELAREVLPGGFDMEGTFMPEGTQLSTGIYSLHYNESVFLDPFVYRPERWIVDEESGVSATDVARAESAFSPFSMGPRACVGKNLAYLELSITMARIFYLLDFKVQEGSTLGAGSPDLMWGRRNENQYQVTDYLVASKQGPMVQFRKR